jgi:hypothetical protein
MDVIRCPPHRLMNFVPSALSEYQVLQLIKIGGLCKFRIEQLIKINT